MTWRHQFLEAQVVRLGQNYAGQLPVCPINLGQRQTPIWLQECAEANPKPRAAAGEVPVVAAVGLAVVVAVGIKPTSYCPRPFYSAPGNEFP